MTTVERLCVDCDRRPLPKDGSRERCRPCHQRFEAEQQEQVVEAAERKTRRKWTDPLNMCRYSRVFLWQRHLVGYTDGITEEGRAYATQGFFYLICAPTEQDAARFGQRLVDMNSYQPGLDRTWVKRFKAMIKAADPIAGTRLNWDGCL